MRRRLWVLVFPILIWWSLFPALAAPRVLPGPEGAAVSAPVQGLRALSRMTGSVRVIVGLRVAFAPEAGLSAAEGRQQAREIAAAATAFRSRFAAAAARSPGSFRSFDSLPFAALEVTPAELDRLAADPAVTSITQDLPLKATLLRSVPFIRANEAWGAGFTGLGETVAVLDTGIDASNSAFAGRIVSEACYASVGGCPDGSYSSTAPGSGQPCRSVDCGHGTHVAGIVAARGGYYPFRGVAPDATLISIRVFSDTGYGEVAWLSDVIKGMDRVYQLRKSFPIAAVNMSIGFDARYASTCDGVSPAMTAAIRQLRAAGIVTVIASGNAGDATRMSFPACISEAVSVGSVSDINWGLCSFTGITSATTAADKVACYSNASRQLTLLAPGSPITSTLPNNGLDTYHGTSMAAPHVSGAFAILRQKQPGLSVDEMVDALRSTGVPVTDYRNAAIVTPRIDVKAALDSIAGDDGKLPVRLSFAGNGRGTVTFTPPGSKASCTASCASRYDPGAVVTLSATPDASMSFAGWSGACSGTGPCTVTVSAATSVGVLFYAISSGPPQQLSYVRAGRGAGSVAISADGFTQSCDASCTRSYGLNTVVTLTAVPAYGSTLAGWSGVCKGRKTSCTVRMSSAKSVAATFNTLPVATLSYRQAGTGAGAVDISVADSVITCRGSCAYGYPAGTTLTLTARAAAGAAFKGWTGSCRGAKTSCTLRMRSSAAVTATFN